MNILNELKSNRIFDNNMVENFKEETGYDYKMGVNSYERFMEFNRELTLGVYNHLNQNNTLWKILCGLEIEMKWSNEKLEEVSYLKNGERYKEGLIYKYRYMPEYYLAFKW